jgi:hypothetical protein
MVPGRTSMMDSNIGQPTKCVGCVEAVPRVTTFL